VVFHRLNFSSQIKLINELPIGGGMVWSIETDDFQNVCGEGRNPLLTYILTAMNGVIPTPDPDRTTTSTTPTVTYTAYELLNTN
jgi:hypothetical protein